MKPTIHDAIAFVAATLAVIIGITLLADMLIPGPGPQRAPSERRH